MGVDTATGLGFACPVAAAVQCHIMTMLEHLAAAYGWHLIITSDRGPHFTTQKVQAWAHTNDGQWQLHVPHHSQAAGMIE